MGRKSLARDGSRSDELTNPIGPIRLVHPMRPASCRVAVWRAGSRASIASNRRYCYAGAFSGEESVSPP